MADPKQFELPYVAGIIDGEGTIGFHRVGNHAYVRVIVGHTDLQLVTALREQFGGRLIQHTRQKAHFKPCYDWTLENDAAVDFLDRISPWLFVKRGQALLALKYQTIDTKLRSKSASAFQEVMHQLNKRGV